MKGNEKEKKRKSREWVRVIEETVRDTYTTCNEICHLQSALTIHGCRMIPYKAQVIVTGTGKCSYSKECNRK